MPSTISDIMSAVRLDIGGSVQWGTTVPCRTQGIYIISVSSDPHYRGTLAHCIDKAKVTTWLSKAKGLRLDGTRPTAKDVVARLASFWLPDESILYIGKAGKDDGSKQTVSKRVRAFYRTDLGRPGPHAGGHWLKTLANLDELYVFWAATPKPEVAEKQLLAAFIANVSPTSKSALYDPSKPLPFANLEFPHGQRKGHGISGATDRR